MRFKYYPPTFNEEQFHCPHCNVYAEQEWYKPHYQRYAIIYIDNFNVSFCTHCEKQSFWHNEKLIYPDSSMAPLPHEDLPADLQIDYLETRSILNKSPRGSAALLRLCLQKLMVELGEPGKDINKDIGSLVFLKKSNKL